MHGPRRMHGSCIARDSHAVLIVGPSGSGKSDLVLRLLRLGFELVADDQVDIVDGEARCPAATAGLLEVRGLGVVRLPHRAGARLALVVALGGAPAERLPRPERHALLGVPVVRIDGTAASAAERVALALDCATGRVTQMAGAFA